MFIQLTRYEIHELLNNKLAQPVSRWETLDKARTFYEEIEGIFTGYKANPSELKSAYSTPVIVYKINKLPTR
jgi:hypothetical protein